MGQPSELRPLPDLTPGQVARLEGRVAKFGRKVDYIERRAVELQSSDAPTWIKDGSIDARQKRLDTLARAHKKAWHKYLEAMNALYGADWPTKQKD